MRIIAFLLFVTMFQAYAIDLYSQDNRLTLSATDMQLRQLFKTIEKQSNFMFFYVDSDIEGIDVNVNVKEATVKAVLSQALAKTGLVYEMYDRYITILPDNMERDALNAAARQGITITGTVVDEGNQTMPGVNVVIKGTTVGTITDENGKFSIAVPDNNAILVFSFMGYSLKEVTVGVQRIIDITLAEDVKQLDEVVVIGYGTQKKATVGGAVTQLNLKQIKSSSVATTSRLLQGQVAGLQTAGKGGPASSADITIRGKSTLSISSAPLVIIDGVEGDINTINPQQIETLTVLKDATTAGIYGSRAAGGVIIITTKQGKEGAPKIDVSYTYGASQFYRMPHALSGQEQALLQNEALINNNEAPYWTPEQIAGLPTTNWVDAITRTGQRHEVNLSILGGTSKFRYGVMSNYLDENGAVMNNWTKRFNTRVKVDFDLTKWLSLGANVFGTYSKSRGGPELVSAMQYSSFIPEYLPDGRPGIYNPEWPSAAQRRTLNPVQGQDEVVTGYSNYTPKFNLYNVFTGEVRFTKNLKFNTILNYSIYTQYAKKYYPDYAIYDALGAGKGSIVSDRTIQNRAAEAEMKYGWNVGTQNYFTYSNVFNGAHDVNVMAGYREFKDNNGAEVKGKRSNYPNNFVQNVGQGQERQEANGKDYNYSTRRSFFGRATYSYLSKYIAEFTLSYDGSDRFGPNNKYGLFPGGALSWRISEESFMESISGNWLDELKLRASYGVLGNDRIDQFLYYSRVNVYGAYPFGGISQQGASENVLPNPDIKWESTATFNVGLDVGFLQGWNATIEVYNKNTRDMLFKMPVSNTTGYTEKMSNIANLNNRGFELTLGYSKSFNEFDVSARLILSRNKNKITKLFGGLDKYVYGPWSEYAYVVGESASIIYGQKIIGIYETEADLLKYPREDAKVGLGDFIYEDVNGDNMVNANDYQPIGDSEPKMVFGFNLNLGWKGWDFGCLLQGNFDRDVVSGYETRFNMQYIDENVMSYINNRWNGPGTYKGHPRVLHGSNNSALDYWTQDATYLKIRHIELGYRFPQKWCDAMRINGLRLYFSAVNPFTFSKYYGWDPETPGGDERYSYYPVYRTFTGGINLTF